jgi:2-dehydropantoate 2-reductase
MTETILRIDGEVGKPLDLSFSDLRAFADDDQVRDVSRVDPRRRGDGVTLGAVLERVDPNGSAEYVTLHASSDGFVASVPLELVRDKGIIVYQLDGETLPASEGGAIRFLIRESAACRTAELDDCANVKHVDRIELTAEKGSDSRR